MKTNYLVLESSTYKIIDSAKNYCKKIRNYACAESGIIIFYLPCIEGTQAIAKINRVNQTNY